MSESQNYTQRENIALINYIINKLDTTIFCSFGLLKVGDGYAQFNKGYRNKYNYIGPALPNNIEAFNNETRYLESLNDETRSSISNHFINSINNPEQYTRMPTFFLFKKMDQAYLREIIKNKEDLFKIDLKSLYQTDEVNENHINHFYENYNIYVTPFRFIYCQLKESQDLNFNMYFMSYTTSALIRQDNLNIYEDCDSITRDNETRLLRDVVDDVFVQPYVQPVTNSNRPPTTPPSVQRPRSRRSAPNSTVSSLNSGSPEITQRITAFPQVDSPSSDNSSPMSNFLNTTPSRSTGSRSVFEGGKRKTKKGRNKKTKRKSNQPLKKVEPKIKRGSCKGRSPCNKNKHK